MFPEGPPLDEFERLVKEAEKAGEHGLLVQGEALENEIGSWGDKTDYERAMWLAEEMNKLTKWVCTDPEGNLNVRLFKVYEYHPFLQADGGVKFTRGLELRRK